MSPSKIPSVWRWDTINNTRQFHGHYSPNILHIPVRDIKTRLRVFFWYDYCYGFPSCKSVTMISLFALHKCGGGDDDQLRRLQGFKCVTSCLETPKQTLRCTEHEQCTRKRNYNGRRRIYWIRIGNGEDNEQEFSRMLPINLFCCFPVPNLSICVKMSHQYQLPFSNLNYSLCIVQCSAIRIVSL